MPYSEAVTQHHGFFHGGVIGMVADVAGGYAAMTLCEPGWQVLSVEYKINFITPAAGSAIIATGHVVRAGRALIVTRMEVGGVGAAGPVAGLRGGAADHHGRCRRNASPAEGQPSARLHRNFTRAAHPDPGTGVADMTAGSLVAKGCAAYAAGRLAVAEAAFRAVADSVPDDADALSNLGAVLNATQRHVEAEAACRAALARQPQFWAAWANLGTALHSQQRFGEALTAYATAVRQNPGAVSSWTNLGVALAEQGMVTQSLAAHEAAVSLAPQDPEVRANQALALLSAGDLARGFAENEWRWQVPGMRPHGVPGPRWQGDDPAGAHHPGA